MLWDKMIAGLVKVKNFLIGLTKNAGTAGKGMLSKVKNLSKSALSKIIALIKTEGFTKNVIAVITATGGIALTITVVKALINKIKARRLLSKAKKESKKKVRLEDTQSPLDRAMSAGVAVDKDGNFNSESISKAVKKEANKVFDKKLEKAKKNHSKSSQLRFQETGFMNDPVYLSTQAEELMSDYEKACKRIDELFLGDIPPEFRGSLESSVAYSNQTEDGKRKMLAEERFRREQLRKAHAKAAGLVPPSKMRQYINEGYFDDMIYDRTGRGETYDPIRAKYDPNYDYDYDEFSENPYYAYEDLDCYPNLDRKYSEYDFVPNGKEYIPNLKKKRYKDKRWAI